MRCTYIGTYEAAAGTRREKSGRRRRHLRTYPPAGFEGNIDGITYCNTGDWVENCTALVEHTDGRLELLHWMPEYRAANSKCMPELLKLREVDEEEVMVPLPAMARMRVTLGV